MTLGPWMSHHSDWSLRRHQYRRPLSSHWLSHIIAFMRHSSWFQMLRRLRLSMLMFLKLHMLTMFTLQMYSMLSAGLGWYDRNPPQPLDPWRGHPLMRRSGERMMRAWDNYKAPRLVFLFGAYWHLPALTKMHWFELWARSKSRLPLPQRDWFTWWRLGEPLA